MITNDPEILLCLRTADCIPVFLYDPAGQVIAMAHSGWRGTCSGISVNTVCAMEKLFGTDPGQVIAAFGPCVCGNCYEVGPELIEDFSKRFSADERRIFFRKDRPERIVIIEKRNGSHGLMSPILHFLSQNTNYASY